MTHINRSNTVLKANPKRVILLYNSLGADTYVTKSRAHGLMMRILDLSVDEVESMYKEGKTFNSKDTKGF
jgi:DNA polymerase elongation subunit (family B)